MSFLNAIFGSKPSVPTIDSVDTSAEQLAAIKGNLAALPSIEGIASEYNKFTQQQLLDMAKIAIPNFQQLSDNISSNLASWTKGEIPTDVSNQIQNNSAVTSLAGGYAGSGMARNLTARDLGLTSLQIMQSGQDATTRWMQALRAPQFDLSSMFVSPALRIQSAFQNASNKFQNQWLKAQVKAMPDPVMRGVHDMVMSAVDAYLGGTYTGFYNQGNYISPSGVGASQNSMMQQDFNSGNPNQDYGDMGDYGTDFGGANAGMV